MGFAVYHGSKGKASGGGVGHHIDRTEGMEHTYQHADPKRINLNMNLIPENEYSKMSLPKAIKQRIEKGYQGKKKIRNDSVKYLSHVLTGSHEDMKKIFSDQNQRQSWLQKNYDFVASEYGKENILRFTLHLDEKTPHLHAITVPLTADGRLSAKEVYGNKGALTARQDRYAEAMNEFGLQRGLKRTGIKNDKAADYYARISQAQRNVENTISEPSRNILGGYKESSVLEMQEALKSAHLALSDLKEKYKREQLKAFSKSKAAERALTTVREKTVEIKEYQKLQERAFDIIRDPEESKRVREKILLMDQEQNREKTQNRNRGIGY